MKTSDFKDFFIKATNIFSKDLYIIHNKYLVGGEFTEKKNSGYTMCTINERAHDILGELFNESKCYYIPDIKLFKKDNHLFIELRPEDEMNGVAGDMRRRLERELDLINKYGSTEVRLLDTITVEDMDTLFTKNGVVAFDFGEYKKVFLGKDVFPLISRTTASTVLFSPYYDEIARLQALIIHYPYRYFDVYTFLHYIDIERKDELIRG